MDVWESKITIFLSHFGNGVSPDTSAGPCVPNYHQSITDRTTMA